jgi:phosphatidylserine/phosphatidylglycerophosphate/cardiolipin synthase-like enzyme
MPGRLSNAGDIFVSMYEKILNARSSLSLMAWWPRRPGGGRRAAAALVAANPRGPEVRIPNEPSFVIVGN